MNNNPEQDTQRQTPLFILFCSLSIFFMKKCIKQYSLHSVVFIILIAIAVISWSYVDHPNERYLPEKYAELTTSSLVQASTTLPTDTKKSEPQKQHPLPLPNTGAPIIKEEILTSNSTTTQQQEIFPINQLIIGENIYDIAYIDGTTVYDMMMQLHNDAKLTIKTKNYGQSLGYFITEINGIRHTNESDNYWIYYINGKKATLGISSYTLLPHDIIEWKYEENEF